MEITKLLASITEKGFDISKASALEVFGYDGSMHVLGYADKVKTLDIWEYNAEMEGKLRINIPFANIKICDSYKQVKCNTAPYDMIIIDNPIQTQYGHCEHFDLFPDIFKIMNNECLLILNIIPDSNKSYPELESNYHLDKRKLFYNAIDPKHITNEEITSTYNNLAANNGFNLEWYLTQSRGFVYYLTMKLKRWVEWQQ